MRTLRLRVGLALSVADASLTRTGYYIIRCRAARARERNRADQSRHYININFPREVTLAFRALSGGTKAARRFKNGLKDP